LKHKLTWTDKQSEQNRVQPKQEQQSKWSVSWSVSIRAGPRRCLDYYCTVCIGNLQKLSCSSVRERDPVCALSFVSVLTVLFVIASFHVKCNVLLSIVAWKEVVILSFAPISPKLGFFVEYCSLRGDLIPEPSFKVSIYFFWNFERCVTKWLITDVFFRPVYCTYFVKIPLRYVHNFLQDTSLLLRETTVSVLDYLWNAVCTCLGLYSYN